MSEATALPTVPQPIYLFSVVRNGGKMLLVCLIQLLSLWYKSIIVQSSNKHVMPQW